MISILFWIGVPIILICVPALIMYLNSHDKVNWLYSIDKFMGDKGIHFVAIVLGALMLVAVCIIWPADYCGHLSEIQQFKAAKVSVLEARQRHGNSILDQGYEFERAAVISKIVEYNAWLAKVKYWGNKPLLDMFYPDEIKKLTPIE